MELSVVLSLPVLPRVLAQPWGLTLAPASSSVVQGSCPYNHLSCPPPSGPLLCLPHDTDP